MTPTLLEGAIALLLLWLAWRIGRIVGPWMWRKLRGNRPGRHGRGGKNPPTVIDV